MRIGNANEDALYTFSRQLSSPFSPLIDLEVRQAICQEIGHDWGLDHQDESGADLNTCMDYSDGLDNPHPNRHDYDQLESIYAHLDSTTTVAPLAASFAIADERLQSSWGRKVHEAADGRSAVFVRHFGAGRAIYTHVTWAR